MRTNTSSGVTTVTCTSRECGYKKNTADDVFCRACGYRLRVSCRSCKYQWMYIVDEYCANCGSDNKQSSSFELWTLILWPAVKILFQILLFMICLLEIGNSFSRDASIFIVVTFFVVAFSQMYVCAAFFTVTLMLIYGVTRSFHPLDLLGVLIWLAVFIGLLIRMARVVRPLVI